MKKSLLCGCLLAVCNLSLLAQTGERPGPLHITEASAIHVPPQETPAGLKKIYSNLGSKADLYDDTSYWAVTGPNSSSGSDFVALAFTPKSNSHVSQVQVAVQYFGSGANQVNLSIYGDTNGNPGTLLAGPVTVTNLPDAGTCCALAVANFSPLALTAGTQYWVVADTPSSGTGSDFTGGWDTTSIPVLLMAGNIGGFGWSYFNADSLVAGEVLGTIP